MDRAINAIQRLTNMDTPETDALYERLLKENPGNLIYLEEMLELARKLERERDEARTERDILKLVDPEWPVFIQQLERERDEAREAFVIATDQMVIAQGKVREVGRERDEARELAHRFRSLYYTQIGIESSASWFPWEKSK